jgi:hypothetical protein
LTAARGSGGRSFSFRCGCAIGRSGASASEFVCVSTAGGAAVTGRVNGQGTRITSGDVALAAVAVNVFPSTCREVQ